MSLNPALLDKENATKRIQISGLSYLHLFTRNLQTQSLNPDPAGSSHLCLFFTDIFLMTSLSIVTLSTVIKIPAQHFWFLGIYLYYTESHTEEIHMGRHVLKLMDLVDEEKKRISSFLTYFMHAGSGSGSLCLFLWPSSKEPAFLPACMPACPWDSSVGAFGGSLRVSPFYMCRTPRSARGEPPPVFLGWFLLRLKHTHMCLTLQIPRRVLVAFCFPNSHMSISKLLWALCSSAFPSVLFLRLFVVLTVLM